MLAAAIELLSKMKLDQEKPTKNVPPNPEHATVETKKAYLRKIASLVVDNYVIDQNRNEKMRQPVGVTQHEAAARQQELTSDGRLRCRAPDCTRTLAQNGKIW